MLDDEVSRRDIVEIKSMLRLLLPKEYSLTYLAQQSGKSRQAVLGYLERNCEPDVDYYKKGKRIFVKPNVALQYISQRA